MNSPAIVFDIGNVLVSFSLDPFHHFFAKHAAKKPSQETIEAVTRSARKYELGQINCEEFTTFVGNFFKKSPGHEQIAGAWNSIFTPNPEMIALAQELSKKYTVAILSNTNELHWQYLDQNFELSKFATEIILSHRIGSLKPEQKIYKATEDRLKLPSSNIVFFDDKDENIEAALKLGWKAFRHNNKEKTLKTLNKLKLHT